MELLRDLSDTDTIASRMAELFGTQPGKHMEPLRTSLLTDPPPRMWWRRETLHGWELAEIRLAWIQGVESWGDRSLRVLLVSPDNTDAIPWLRLSDSVGDCAEFVFGKAGGEEEPALDACGELVCPRSEAWIICRARIVKFQMELQRGRALAMIELQDEWQAWEPTAAA